jgi:NAD-dependent SIR2 family protein deacetylase
MDLPAQLDLLSEDVADPTNASLLNRLCIALRTKQRIIAVVGAGISVSAGSKHAYKAVYILSTLLTLTQFQTLGRPPVYSRKPQNIKFRARTFLTRTSTTIQLTPHLSTT